MQLVDTADGSDPRVLVLTGEPGGRKSILVDWAASQTEAHGGRVLWVRGCEGEKDLGFAGVHQLLRPVLTGVERLPSRQRDALRCVFGMDQADGSQVPDPLLIRLGVLTLLSDTATDNPC
ncbi:hypothetical protein [Streptomyces sanglieri]|uniref:hypothetical protein n=1 Tax=Streptomyces sanglieri TaxID=193460 RepID=UPI003526506D